MFENRNIIKSKIKKAIKSVTVCFKCKVDLALNEHHQLLTKTKNQKTAKRKNKSQVLNDESTVLVSLRLSIYLSIYQCCFQRSALNFLQFSDFKA